MKAGFWQLVILGVLVLVFFRPVVLAVARALARGRGEPEARRRASLASVCPHCRARLPDGAEYCPRCGRRVGCIDV